MSDVFIDVFLESTGALVTAIIFFTLLSAMRFRTVRSQPGYRLIIFGFGLILFGLAIDITDNFPQLNYLVVVGDTPVEAFLEKVVGGIIGLFLVALGFRRWIPCILELEKTRISLDTLNRDLDGRVQQRTSELEVVNKQLHQTNTELVRSNQVLKYTQAQLVQSVKLASIGQMAAGLAHELNQPLTAMQATAGFTKLILEREQDVDRSKVIDNLNKISASIVRVSKIIEHLKIFSRQEKLREYEKADINWLIEESFVLMDETLRLAGIDIQKELTEDCSEVLCDYIQIEQVLTNLISNAKDSLAESDEKHLVVRSYRRGNNMCIDVKDTGCGMSKTIKEKAFDPFFTSKPVGQGVGLGLFISYGIIQDHKGSLVVSSKKGEGSCFTITLPLDS